jgi:hypothetical protein
MENGKSLKLMTDFLAEEPRPYMQSLIPNKSGSCFSKNVGRKFLVVIEQLNLVAQRKDLWP